MTARRYPIPGIEKYPDLAGQLDAELKRQNCTDCERAVIIRKYEDRIKRRQRTEQHP